MTGDNKRLTGVVLLPYIASFEKSQPNYDKIGSFPSKLRGNNLFNAIFHTDQLLNFKWCKVKQKRIYIFKQLLLRYNTAMQQLCTAAWHQAQCMQSKDTIANGDCMT